MSHRLYRPTCFAPCSPIEFPRMVWQLSMPTRPRCQVVPKLPTISQRWLTACVLSIAVLLFGYILISGNVDFGIGLLAASSKSQRPREAYVLFNPSSQLPVYMEHCHLLTIFGFKHDTELCDPLNRDVIVMVTEFTDSEDIIRMEEAGAKIFRAPYSLKSIMPTRES